MNSARPHREIPQPTGLYLDYGPALPERYGSSKMRLLVQDPFRLYGYWELAEPALEPPMLVLRDLTAGRAEIFRIAADVAEYWLDARPDRRYRLELQLGDRVVLVSNEVLTPRAGPSDVIDPAWPVDDETLAAILKASGAVHVGKGGFYGGAGSR